MNSKNAIAFILSIIFLAACNKPKPSNIGDIKMSDYPVKVNDSWTYQVIDSLHHVTDTAIFSITAKTVVNSDSSIYNYQTTVNNVIVDTGTITQAITGYAYFPTTSSYLFSTLKLRFPISGHSGWQGDSPADTLYVLNSFQSYTVLGKTYANVYLINRRVMMVDNSLQATIYIAPSIGIIREDFVASPWIPQNKSIRLISYSIN